MRVNFKIRQVACAISSGNSNLQRLLDGARDISAVFYVKIQIGGKFLVEKLINSMNIYLFSIVACFVFFLSQNE